MGIPALKSLVVGWGGGGLFDYSVKPGPDLSRLRLSLVRLVTGLARSRTRLVKARAMSLTIIQVVALVEIFLNICKILTSVIEF